MMDFFNLLPNDIQRMICFFYLPVEDIEKINPKFYNNPNDIYWKQKVAMTTSEKTPEDATHRDFYDFFRYKCILNTQGWEDELLTMMVKNAFFLTKHINLRNEVGMTALMYAVLSSKKEIVKTLLNANVDIDIEDDYGWTALMYAVSLKRSEIVKILIAAKANVNKKSRNGNTALMCAARTSNGLLQILLDAGANINECDNYGYSALMHAVNNHEYAENVEILLLNGADINLQNNCGRTAFHLANSPKIKKLLTDYQLLSSCKITHVKDYYHSFYDD